jgi:DNA-binding transcriptional LysR family regulator
MVKMVFSFRVLEMDRLESMSILVTAVEMGSLSAAGRRLGTPLATVSRKVSELEAHLKTRLLNRSSRRVSLTDAGRAYVAACKRIKPSAPRRANIGRRKAT